MRRLGVPGFGRIGPRRMGYTHYWNRPHVMAQPVFHAIRVDFERLILPLADVGAELAGPSGEGLPDITDEAICFNGVAQCGHPRNEEITIPCPSEFSAGSGPSSTAIDDESGLLTMVKHRCCNGSCACETFRFPKCAESDGDEPYHDFVKTAFRPYDVAVTAALLIAKKHLKDRLTIESNGGDRQWADARRLCQQVLGYGDWFGIVEKKIIEELPGDPSRGREVTVRTLVELDPATL